MEATETGSNEEMNRKLRYTFWTAPCTTPGPSASNYRYHPRTEFTRAFRENHPLHKPAGQAFLAMAQAMQWANNTLEMHCQPAYGAFRPYHDPIESRLNLLRNEAAKSPNPSPNALAQPLNWDRMVWQFQFAVAKLAIYTYSRRLAATRRRHGTELLCNLRCRDTSGHSFLKRKLEQYRSTPVKTLALKKLYLRQRLRPSQQHIAEERLLGSKQ